ncbi:MAG: RNA polymerase sigma factor [Armatimonadetes bacterium]|nr:RNA polymerase sigma factor [Armatimonadota bacterium]
MKRFWERAQIRKILNGDPAESERFVLRHYPNVYRFLCRLTENTDAAEDLTQQTFLKAWEGLGTFRGDSSLSTWLHRIAYHEYTHWLRSRRSHLPLDEDLLIDDRAGGELEGVLLRHALARLTPEHREAFVLHHVQGLSVAEAAQVLQAPAGTVKSRLHAARAHLRTLLSESQEDTIHEASTPRP